jgi:imidazolonepropionase-like amidohydrolase
MSPMEAITSATADSARSCRLDGTVGTLQPGKRADLLVVDGDPTVNIGDLWNVVDVFQGGRRVDRGSAQAGTGGD